MRSTQKKGPRTRAVRRMHQAASATALAQLIWRSTSAMFAATRAAKHATGFREPPEPEPTIQIAPTKPLSPAGGAARPITMTTLPDGHARLDVGDESIALSPEEAGRLRVLTGAPLVVKTGLRVSAPSPAAETTGQLRVLASGPCGSDPTPGIQATRTTGAASTAPALARTSPRETILESAQPRSGSSALASLSALAVAFAVVRWTVRAATGRRVPPSPRPGL